MNENQLQVISPENLTPDIIKQRVCPEATDQEIFLFLQIAKVCKLNPFLNQIYLVKYGNQKAQILTSYNVYLQRAERSGSYAGLETSTTGSVAGGDLKATVKVFRKDWERPLIHEVYYEEYVQHVTDKTTGKVRANKFWAEKPRTMITKVAISQAFRLAFPLDFEGMPYTQDEMPQVYDIEAKETTMKPEVRIPTEKTAVNTPKLNDFTEEVSTSKKPEITQPSENLKSKQASPEVSWDEEYEAIESLARLAFKGKRKEWNTFIGTEFGCEAVSELTEEQLKKCAEKLNGIIKDAKK